MLYGSTNELYERALRTHERHNENFGYPMHVLREQILPGWGPMGYWNKPSYLLSLVLSELAKPEEERSEWLMWIDADLIIINPLVPLEVFLPEPDFPDIHFVGNKDQNGLNTGTCFIHVHEWTVRAFTKAMGYPMFRPDIDLGYSVDQEAMAHVFNETEFRDGVMYMPRPWFNTYEFHHAYEGKKGDLLVHFPGLFDERWQHMSDWLEVVEKDPDEWAVKFEDTDYPDKISKFWTEIRRARTIKQQAEERLALAPNWADEVAPKLEHLQQVLWDETDSLDAVTTSADRVKNALSL